MARECRNANAARKQRKKRLGQIIEHPASTECVGCAGEVNGVQVLLRGRRGVYAVVAARAAQAQGSGGAQRRLTRAAVAARGWSGAGCGRRAVVASQAGGVQASAGARRRRLRGRAAAA